MPSRLFRENFDRARNFVATRSFRFAGVLYEVGDPIQKDAFPTRRLRQLYDQRVVGYGEAKPTATPAQAVATERHRPTGGSVQRRRAPTNATVSA